MQEIRSASFESPLGLVTVKSTGGSIVRLKWGRGTHQKQPETQELRDAIQQLRAYFAGQLSEFDLPLDVTGTDFQKAVCQAIRDIPMGETRTYGDLAKTLGASAQAVGNACGANPIPIIIPCHRVLSATSLGGFSGSGGIESKVWLLRHEKAAGLLI